MEVLHRLLGACCLLGVHALEGAVTLPIILRRLQSRQQLPVRDVCGIAA